jgi:hypothetical protein
MSRDPLARWRRVASYWPAGHHRHALDPSVRYGVWLAAEARAWALALEQAGAVVEIGPPIVGEPYRDEDGRWWAVEADGSQQRLMSGPEGLPWAAPGKRLGVRGG